ncbi:MAG: aldo/keto reductase [Planctomycetota bacterium]|jgi:aryl-alcohol dehydrogenase-like predicted oxidoreductase
MTKQLFQQDMETKTMRTRRLGNTDLELTVIGLGTWAIGGPWQFGWGPQDDADSIRTILAAMDGGINWIDTAPIYGCGHSETIVGLALREISEKPLVATKCSLLWNDKREKVNCLDHDSIIKECEDSLKRLGVEVIDLYQMHWPQPEAQLEEGWEAMATLVQQGKVRYIGVSNFSLEQLQRVAAIHPVTSLQPPYSMLRRDIEAELIPYCGKNNIGIVAYSPMQKGLLTGKFSKEHLATLAPDDHRLNDPNFSGEQFEKNLAIVESLKSIAGRNGKTVAQLAIAWALRKEEVTAAIVGARKQSQIEETVQAGDWVLGDEEIEEISRILE